GVISICMFHSGEALNVIPQTAVLQGTARSLTPQVRDLIERRIVEVAEATARLHGASAKATYERKYPVTKNHAPQTEFAAGVAAQVAGMDKVNSNVAPVMGGEDFSFMLEARPGAFIFIGNGDSAGVHHPQYDFNDAAIPSGISYWARLAETAMPA
ncbi:MAG: M20/M25/M40 family metallo-hydrolase, partial [Hyphomicrobiaceae bacterium]